MDRPPCAEQPVLVVASETPCLIAAIECVSSERHFWRWACGSRDGLHPVGQPRVHRGVRARTELVGGRMLAADLVVGRAYAQRAKPNDAEYALHRLHHGVD